MPTSDDTRDFRQSLIGLIKSVRSFNFYEYGQRRPAFYYILIFGLALLGYAFLLMFPFMAFYALAQLAELVRQPMTEPMLLSCVSWSSLFIFSIAMSHHVFSMRFPMPKGLILRNDKTPELFALLANKQNGWFGPDISQVVITDKYELDIQKIPVCGFPFWSKDVLVVGLPMLQCLPQHYFEILLQRKLIQFSRGRNLFTNWLYQLSAQWMLFPVAFGERNLLGDKLIFWFYKLYAPRFRRYAAYAAQRDELIADTLTLAGVNDSDLLKSIEAHHIGQHCLQNYYFPLLLEKITKQGIAAEKLSPYTKLPSTIIKMLNDQRIKDCLKLICKQHINRVSAEPPLFARMENIGHNRVRLPEMLSPPSAAQAMLKGNYMKVCQIMDKSWVTMINQQLQRKKKTRKMNATSKVATPIKLGAV
jgi:hypothetical protein